MEDGMDRIFYALCTHSVALDHGWMPFPATLLAKKLDMPVGKVRYHLRKLKKQGLVDSEHYGGYDEDEGVYCYWGWVVTKKGEDTEEYRIAYEKEAKLVKKCFGIDI